MTENKRFNVFDVDGTIFLEDHKEGSYHIGEIGNVDVNCLNDIADRLNELAEDNMQLKQQLKSIEDSFKFSCTENHFEFNKDKLKVEDTHTELTLKDGKLCISVFIPQLNEYVKFFYLVTGRKMEREFINYDGEVE